MSAGFGPDLADVLAHQEQVDLHELLKLVDRGCPPHLAARILAPLDAPLAGPRGDGADARRPEADREGSGAW
jgi:hypothetical protein